jgi:hypothetical protein
MSEPHNGASTRHSNGGASGHRGSREGWTGLMNSMITFTNAATMFTVQQMQNAMTMFSDSRRGVNRFKHAFESLSHAMETEMDDSYRSATEQMNRAGTETMNAMSSEQTNAWDPQSRGHEQDEPELVSSGAQSTSGRKR